MFKRIRLLAFPFAAVALFATTTMSRAQLIYSDDFSDPNDAANWVVNYSDANGPTNSQAIVGFDYSALGVPQAPHSVGGNTKGLKMTPDFGDVGGLLGGAAVPGVSVSPTNFSVSENFIMHADMWINVNGTPYATLQTNNVSGASYATSPHNGSSSTVLYGCGYGTAGTKAIVAGQVDCIFCAVQSDNGSSANMRMYGPKQAGSYQDKVYQSTGTLTPGFPGDPFVYNNTIGTRNWVGSTTSPPFTSIATNAATGVSWGDIFPPAPVPLSQELLFPTLTNNASCPGLVNFKWHDVTVQKIGSVIIYSIDGNIIAEAPYSSAGTPAGAYLMFSAGDISSSPPSAAQRAAYTNLNYVIFANITVSNYDNVVNVAAPTPTITENLPGSPGVFTITRSKTGTPLTVSYTLTGSATNGVQYQSLPLSVTFDSTSTSTNIYVVPIDDGIPSTTTTVILTIQPTGGYAGAGNAVVSILDSDMPTIDVTGGSQAYGRYANDPTAIVGGNNDFIPYTLTRRGKLTIGSDLNVNLSYGGSAVSGTDYTPVSNVTIPDGAATATLAVSPLDNPNVTTNRAVVVNVLAGSGYAVGSGMATGTVVSAHYSVAPITLLSDDLSSSADASKWNITYGCGDPQDNATDFSADFGFDLANNSFGVPIPLPPSGSGTALHLTCNKNGTPASPGAVNIYYTNLFLSGNFAVRFNMSLVQGQVVANNTEGAIFGVNHTGTYSNWWYGSGFITNQTWSSDGVWYFVTAQPGGTSAGDYQEFTGTGGTNGNAGWTRLASQSASSFAQTFKDNYSTTYPGPFTCFDGFGNQTPGVPANASPALGYDASTWCDVEIRQTNKVITMSINHTLVFAYTNTTVWTNGYLMLGYADPFGASVGSPEAGAYFANLQVVQLSPPSVTINGISFSGGNVTIKFTTSIGTDTASSFSLTSCDTVNGLYVPAGASIITALGANQFQATIPYVGGGQLFYRVLRN